MDVKSGMQVFEEKIRDSRCMACKMHAYADYVCEPGTGPAGASIMVVSRMPNSDNYQAMLEQELAEVGIEPADCYFTAAIKCRSFDADPGRTGIKACKQYLDAEIARFKPKWILTMGNEALSATTGHSGIMKYRGRVIDRGAYSVFPTISLAAVQRNPGQRQSFVADLHLFASTMFGKTSKVTKPKVWFINSKGKLRQLMQLLPKAEALAFDVETHGNNEFSEDAAIVSLSGTMRMPSGTLLVWAMPLHHPQSPWRKLWKQALSKLVPKMQQVPIRIAHNGKFDCRWLIECSGQHIDLTFDTILAAAILDENRQKGLKPQASSRLGVPPWDIPVKDWYSTPLRDILTYNALDTYYDYHIYLQMRQELIDQPRQLRIFKLIQMPASNILTYAERRGMWIDRERLASRKKIAFDTKRMIEDKLLEYVPDGTPEELAALGWPTRGRRNALAPINWNASNWSRWFWFTYLKLPVIERGKEKDDGGAGAPSMKEAVMLELKSEHPAVAVHLERQKWEKYCNSYVTNYEEQADENDRLHTTFKLYGTVTGRLSSGKIDEEKVVARTSSRGLNLQQVPRDEFIRGLFGAPPGWLFVEADFSQIELRLVAFVARESTMLRLYQTGQDIHRATASWVLGIPPDQVDATARKKAKAVNFGFVYGMGWRKFIATAFENYELIFTEAEARAIRTSFFERFSGLQRWHARQRRLVHEHARVVSPLGRVRHLPDIRSPNDAVQGEAERQAINSPIQSMASDMNTLSMVLIDKAFHKAGIQDKAQVLGLVHDANNFQVHESVAHIALPIIKNTMENLPLARKFGCEIDLPIIADIKVGTHWGGATELTPEQVYKWKKKYAPKRKAAM